MSWSSPHEVGEEEEEEREEGLELGWAAVQHWDWGRNLVSHKIGNFIERYPGWCPHYLLLRNEKCQLHNGENKLISICVGPTVTLS